MRKGNLDMALSRRDPYEIVMGDPARGTSPARSPTRHGGPAWWRRKSTRAALWRACVYVILVATGVLVLVPFYWQVTSALKPEPDILIFPPKWIPDPATIDNYIGASLGQINWRRIGPGVQRSDSFSVALFLRNTVIIAIGSMIGNLSSSALVAYGLSRIRFKGRDIIFASVLATMFLPWVVTIIPLFVTFSRLGWVNTFLPLIVPCFFGHPFFIFLLRQFFTTVPPDLEDAARIDGCSTFRTFLQIVLPLARPALAAAAIFNFQWAWNDFLMPLLYLNKVHLRTLQLGAFAFHNPYEMRWGVLFAYTSLITMPLIVVFFFAQRLFIQGVVFTGVKG